MERSKYELAMKAYEEWKTCDDFFFTAPEDRMNKFYHWLEDKLN